MSKETVGKASRDLLLKNEPSHSVIDYEREMHKDYEKNILECVERCKKEFFGDFYVLVIIKKERLMQNVIRNYFLGRKSCPTPDWDQTVYSYDRKNDTIKFMWVIPAKDICEYYKSHALEVVPEERELLQFVLDFDDGTLLRLAKKLNGEVQDSPLLEKKGKKYV